MKYWLKTLFFAISIAGILMPTLANAQSIHKKTQPNILFIFADDLGWTDLGYRSGRWQTPHINQLKKQSLEFTRAYVASPTCSPSRAAIVTGQHPARLKMVRHIPGGKKHLGFDKNHVPTQDYHLWPTDPAQEPSRNFLPLSVTSMGEAMKTLGYHTVFAGKWHLGSEGRFPIDQGFDQQFGVSNAGHPKKYFAPFWEKFRNPYPDAPKGKFLTERLTDDVVDFIDGYNKDKPFLLTTSFYSVHTPHQGPKELTQKYIKKGLDKRYANFGAMVESMDTSVGRILNALDKKGLTENTVVVFFSDQGSFFTNAPLRGGKLGGLALYEGGARVPMLVRWPGKIEANNESDKVVISTDLMPTFIELGGGNPANFENLDGQSIVSLLEKGAIAQGIANRDQVYLYRHYEDAYAAVIGQRWKLIAFVSGKIELYDLKNDPSEKQDLAKSNPTQAKKLKDALLAWQKTVDVAPTLKRPDLLNKTASIKEKIKVHKIKS